MSAHTPGQWRVFVDTREEGGLAYVAGYNIESDSGFEIVGVEGICCGPNDEANAHLIAAAPDLLDALNDALCALEVCGKDFNYAMSKAHAAIAKAKGGAK